MDVLELLGEAGRLTLRVFIVIAPLIAWQWIAVWARPYRRRGGGFVDLTILAGMMVGVGMLVVIVDPQILTWDAVTSVGGFWDLNINEFVELARRMVIHSPGALIAALEFDDERRNLEVWLALATALWFVRVIAVWIAGPPLGSVRFLAAELATFTVSVFGTVYLGPLVFWSINRLNFWMMLIAILLIQDYRREDAPLFGRLIAGIRPPHHVPHHGPAGAMPLAEPD